jgi:DNA polymerase I
MDKLVLIDGNSLIHRAYHAYPELTSKSGDPVGAVYGFVSMLLNLLIKLSPSHVVVAWDVSGKLKRKEEFEAYKANRKPMDESLVTQLEITKKVVKIIGIPQFGVEGVEADDLIGSLAKKSVEDYPETQVVIVTGDRDSLQLVKDRQVVVYMPIRNKYSKGNYVFDEERVREDYQMPPSSLVDLKALMGDSSDNLPGVKGVGKVQGTRLIVDYLSLDGVYENLDQVNGRLRALLESGKDMAYKCRELAKIDEDVDMGVEWDDCKLSSYDKAKAVEMFEDLGFVSLLDKLPPDEWEKDASSLFGL